VVVFVEFPKVRIGGAPGVRPALDPLLASGICTRMLKTILLGSGSVRSWKMGPPLHKSSIVRSVPVVSSGVRSSGSVVGGKDGQWI